MSDDGYGEATPETLAKSATLALQAWGKIKGEALIGRKPAANQVITVLRRDHQPGRPGAVHSFYNPETRTDAQGRFVFDRVIPGAGEVARVIVTESRQRQSACTWDAGRSRSTSRRARRC